MDFHKCTLFLVLFLYFPRCPTEQNLVEVDAKVKGNMLSGHLNRETRFEAAISADSLSFVGEVNKCVISGK
jgi:hypothetical protein